MLGSYYAAFAPLLLVRLRGISWQALETEICTVKLKRWRNPSPKGRLPLRLSPNGVQMLPVLQVIHLDLVDAFAAANLSLSLESGQWKPGTLFNLFGVILCYANKLYQYDLHQRLQLWHLGNVVCLPGDHCLNSAIAKLTCSSVDKFG